MIVSIVLTALALLATAASHAANAAVIPVTKSGYDYR